MNTYTVRTLSWGLPVTLRATVEEAPPTPETSDCPADPGMFDVIKVECQISENFWVDVSTTMTTEEWERITELAKDAALALASIQ